MLRSRFAGLLLASGLALAGCGPGGTGEGGGEPTPASSPPPGEALSPAAVPALPASGPCAAYERILAARADAPPFSSLPSDMDIGGDTSCRAESVQMPVGPDRVEETFEAYVCDFGGEPVDAWTEIQLTVGQCFGADWQMAGTAEILPDGGRRRVYELNRPGDFERIELDSGAIDPVNWVWMDTEADPSVRFILLVEP